MVRKTKEEAQATRERILDAAERVFHARGVSATSLHDIAQAAGVTRGAVYWHFKDKADVFDAMLTRVVEPLEQASQASLDGSGPALDRLRRHLTTLFDWIEQSERAQRVFEITSARVEYIDEMQIQRERKLVWRMRYLGSLEDVFAAAQREGTVRAGLPPRPLALGLFALIDGLMHGWLMVPGSFALRELGLQTVDHYLAGLGAIAAAPSPAAAPRRKAAQPGTAKVKPTRVTPS